MADAFRCRKRGCLSRKVLCTGLSVEGDRLVIVYRCQKCNAEFKSYRSELPEQSPKS